MKLAAFVIAVTLGIAAAFGAAPARAGDVSIGFGFSVGSGGGYVGHSGYRSGYRWRRPHGHGRYHRHRGHRRPHWRRHHRRHDHGPTVIYSYEYAKDYDGSVDYEGAPDYPDMSVQSTTVTKAAKDNDYCREFIRDVIIDGKTVQAYGRACRQEDGSWKVVSED